MSQKPINISNYLKQKPKVCKWTFFANSIILLGLLYITIKFFMLGFGDLESSQKQITIGIGIAMILLDIVIIIALRGFLKGNKIAKIAFMLIAVFGSVFAMGYQLIGVLIMIFLIFALFLNVSCYSKIYPSNS